MREGNLDKTLAHEPCHTSLEAESRRRSHFVPGWRSGIDPERRDPDVVATIKASMPAHLSYFDA